jgi:hypothetical protein
MVLFELATLTIEVGKLLETPARIAEYVNAPDAKGRLLGCFLSELGPQNRALVLRGFDSEADLAAERQRGLRSANPFNCAPLLLGLSMESYAQFPFLPPLQTGARGPIYEFRSYILKPGCLTETLEAWSEMVPRRTQLSPVVTAMYALDGPARFTHVWVYPDFAQRAAIRAEALRTKVWPPRSAPHTLTTAMASEIYTPAGISPLQ